MQLIVKISLLSFLWGWLIVSGSVTYAQEGKMFSQEQQLLTIGKERQANVFIDSTKISPEKKSTLFPQPSYPKTLSVVLSIATAQHWDTLDLAPNIFLFWPEPDGEKIAQAVSQGQGYGSEPVTITPRELTDAVIDYIEKAGLVEDKDRGSYIFKFSALNPDLQSKIASCMMEQAINRSPRSYLELWLRDDVWRDARVFYSPPDPILQGAKPDLFAVNWIKTPQGTSRIFVNLRQGGGSANQKVEPTPEEAKVEEAKVTPPTENPPLPQDQIYIIPSPENSTTADQALAVTPLKVEAIAIPISSSPRGISLQVINSSNSSWYSPQVPTDEKLTKTLTMEATRIPLDQLLKQMEQGAGIQIQVSDDVAAEKYLVSCVVNELPIQDAMRVVARLYSLAWEKRDDNVFVLKNAKILPIDSDLVRLGHPTFYRFGESNWDALRSRYAESNEVASQLVDQLGLEALKYPGVPFASLAPEMQQKFRELSRIGISRDVVLNQLNAFKYQDTDLMLEYRDVGMLTVRGKKAAMFLPASPWRRIPPQLQYLFPKQ